MFCPFCHSERVANDSPCSNCGAPSPLMWGSQELPGGAAVSAAKWGASTVSSGMQWGQAPAAAPAQSYTANSWSAPAQNPAVQQPAWLQQPLQQASPLQSQPSAPSSPQGQQPVSLLPVPYQAPVAQGYQQDALRQLVPAQPMEQMLPALPDIPEAVYVPPMYTQPRAIIPRYRVISGLLSFVIVCILLCGGASYYAKASGTLAVLQRLSGGAPPPSLKAPPATPVPNPPDTVDKGPAYNIIPSATTTARVDPRTYIALQPQKIFRVGQTFYITYSVQHPPTKGTVVVKWYMNKIFFKSASSPPIAAGDMVNGDASMVYLGPASGTVELYWNNQLAQRLYFAVR
jgi:hypothetical protein